VLLTIRVVGRPAPQGSKDLGGAGQLIEKSPYLAAWRQAVKIAAFRTYAAAGIDPRDLPLYPAGAPVVIERLTFHMFASQPTSPPDIDKLLRATLDALGGMADKGKTARLFHDDSQVVEIRQLSKVRRAEGEAPGAVIIVSDGRE
jgi:Holliday junction resolvase RusA-like endonuclease